MSRRGAHWPGLAAFASATLAAAGAAGESDWPQFRGPRGDGVAAETADPPVRWSRDKNITWKVRIPGRGRSSPIILGNRIWLTTAAERGVQRKRIEYDDMQTAEHVTIGAVCLDRDTGRILWQVTLFDVARPDPVHTFGEIHCLAGSIGQRPMLDLMPLALAHAGRLTKFGA